MPTHLTLKLSSRLELMALGVVLAHTKCAAESNPELQAKRPARPWLIANRGENSSGKSLIALAADTVLTPELYLNGLTSQTANEYLQGEEGHSPNTILRNFYYELIRGQEAYDRRLLEVADHYRNFNMVFLQNLDRDDLAKNALRRGLESDHLDFDIETRMLPGPFIRQTRIIFRDDAHFRYMTHFMGEFTRGHIALPLPRQTSAPQRPATPSEEPSFYAKTFA